MFANKCWKIDILLTKCKNKQGSRRYRTSPAVCNRTTPPFRPIIDSSNACNQASAPIWTTIFSEAQFSLNSTCFVNLSPISAKLTSLSYVHASKYICFSANVHRYHHNNSYRDVRFGNSTH